MFRSICIVCLLFFAACTTTMKPVAPETVQNRADSALLAVAVSDESYEQGIDAIELHTARSPFRIDLDPKGGIESPGSKLFVIEVPANQAFAVAGYHVGGRFYQTPSDEFNMYQFKSESGKVAFFLSMDVKRNGRTMHVGSSNRGVTRAASETLKSKFPKHGIVSGAM